ncbi:hypothetical protein ABW636_22350, partial [Aquimarina sp. 2201CG1-2-11]|uniref:hypothetical protein n=1 Tax=Aquimarina discodermiae TaxID=3231043 RepID=UPI0034621739
MEAEILKRINTTGEKAYESALLSGIETVKAALSKSTFDGDIGTHASKIRELKSKAKEIWIEKIVKPIR